MTEGDPYTEAASALPRNALKGQFDAKGLDKQAVERVSRLAEFRENMEAMGQLGGSIESVIERYGVRQHSDEAKSRQDQARKKKSGMSDALWIEMVQALNTGTMGAFVGDQVFGGMSDEEIADVVDHIEAQTGMPFEDYAREILGEELPERLPGESEADYHRRILQDLTEEMLDEHGNIKPEYANDPFADILKSDQTYKRIIAERDSIDADMLENGDTAENRQAGKDHADQSFEAAQNTDADAKADVFKDIGNESQEEQIEADAASDQKAAKTTSFLSKIKAEDGISNEFNSNASSEQPELDQAIDRTLEGVATSNAPSPL